jgi:hypothetical protein
MCVDHLDFKFFSWTVCGSKLGSRTFDFIKILAQIKNNVSKVQKNEK